MKRYLINLWSNHKTTILAWGIVFLVYIITMAAGISCPIKFLTGISCAGCGMTRACLSALRFDFTAAFEYHPLWITLPFTAFFLIFFKLKKNEKAFDITLFVFAFIMFAVYFYRLFFLDGDIVVFSPKSGYISKVIKNLFPK